MYDPFLDSLDESKSLPTPLVPSRTPTPAPLPSSAAAEPSTQQSTSLNPPLSSTPDVAALFDPLGDLPATPRAPEASFSTTAASSKPADEAQSTSKRRPTLLTIATTVNPPQLTTTDPLNDLLARNSPEKPKAKRQFSTTPLFSAPQPQPIYMVLPTQAPVRPKLGSRHPSRQGSSHAREASDDFGGFVSVPAAADPLSTSASHSPNATPSILTTASTNNSGTANGVVNDFTLAAKQRHAENASRIMDEFARSEANGGDLLGWLDNLEKEEQEAEARGETREHWIQEREKKLKGEEGPISPPATPTEGPPPATRTPKRGKKDAAVEGAPGVASSTKDTEGAHPGLPRAGSKEKIAGSGPGSGSGISSYFPATLPRRLTTLLSNPTPATAIASSPRRSDEFTEEDAEDADTRAIFAMPGSSSLENLSSMQPVRPTKAIPDSFLSHHTPFASVKYVPPTGAPGYAGESGWDTGGFAADWEQDGVITEEMTRKEAKDQLKVKRVMKLIGRKDETAGVLTRGLADAIRPKLPALARLCSKWSLLYSLDQHGISLHTFYNLSSSSASSTNKISGGRKGALIVIRDSFDAVFGAWIGEGVRMLGTSEGHYGGGDSFLWRTTSVVPDPSQEEDEGDLPDIDVYRWTGKNDYIALCEPDFVSLGGGDDGKTGLYLASNLLDGSSAKSMTFNNDILCGEEEVDDAGMDATKREERTVKFEVIGLEVWGLVAS